ncbi:MAG: TatD family hydrolase [Lachnoclostridium sp.]|jgi:TatD DNase family protein|nr:TatD family hydrolase [Lachnoclostridium sp.]
MIIDTHGHYDDKRYNNDRNEILYGLADKGVKAVINSGADFKGCKDTCMLAASFSFVYGTLGIHPNNSNEMSEEILEWIRIHARESKIVGIGEIGLDYYDDEPSRKLQQEWFIKQLHLARELKLPVVIHSRDAAEDTLRILKEEKAGMFGGTMHCYSYSKEMAKQLIDIGFHIGIGGIVTFKNARKLKETVEAISLQDILLETDCPYLSPEPNRGGRNDSAQLIYVVEEIARIKGTSKEIVMDVTSQNAKEVFGLQVTR